MRKKTKKAMTLLEIMIVIFIIGLVGSVIGYNMRGSLDQGKAFRTQEGINKAYQLVHLVLTSSEIRSIPKDNLGQAVLQAVTNSGLVSRPNNYLKDGWGNKLEFKVEEVNGNCEIRMTSRRYEEFCAKKNRKTDYPWEEEEEL